jgi:hypothetical protein
MANPALQKYENLPGIRIDTNEVGETAADSRIVLPIDQLESNF